MCAPKPPKAPDMVAAAQAQGAANVDAARATAQLSNPNIITPYGTQTVTYEGDIPTMTQTFSPQEQALYETNTQMRQELGDVGVKGAGALGQVIGQNLDLSGLPAGPGDSAATRDKVYDAMMSRVNQDLGRREEDTRSTLVAQGIRPGTPAWDTEMERIDRARTDAGLQAQIAAGGEASRDFGMDSELRRTALAEYLTGRQTPLNEVTALMSGSQVSNPFAQVGGYQAGAVTQPTPILAGQQAQWGADMDRYAQQSANSNALVSGLFGLGSAGIGAWGARG